MRPTLTVMFGLALAIAAASAATAQTRKEPQFKDNIANFDRKKFVEQFDRLEKQSVAATARSIRRHSYCLECGNGDRIECKNHVVDGLPAMVENLDSGADANGGEKCDDEDGNSAAQQGLGSQQAAIRRLGDRLRETLNGIRACRRTRQPGARHCGLRFLEFPQPPASEGCTASLSESLPIGIDGG